jgi:hypothetical protein
MTVQAAIWREAESDSQSQFMSRPCIHCSKYLMAIKKKVHALIHEELLQPEGPDTDQRRGRVAIGVAAAVDGAMPWRRR